MKKSKTLKNQEIKNQLPQKIFRTSPSSQSSKCLKNEEINFEEKSLLINNYQETVVYSTDKLQVAQKSAQIKIKSPLLKLTLSKGYLLALIIIFAQVYATESSCLDSYYLTNQTNKHSRDVYIIKASPDNKTLYTADYDGGLKVWDFSMDSLTLRLRQNITDPTNRFIYYWDQSQVIVVWNNGQRLYVGGSNGKLKIYYLNSTTGLYNNTPEIAVTLTYALNTIDVSSDGNTVYVGGGYFYGGGVFSKYFWNGTKWNDVTPQILKTTLFNKTMSYVKQTANQQKLITFDASTRNLYIFKQNEGNFVLSQTIATVAQNVFKSCRLSANELYIVCFGKGTNSQFNVYKLNQTSDQFFDVSKIGNVSELFTYYSSMDDNQIFTSIEALSAGNPDWNYKQYKFSYVNGVASYQPLDSYHFASYKLVDVKLQLASRIQIFGDSNGHLHLVACLCNNQTLSPNQTCIAPCLSDQSRDASGVCKKKCVANCNTCVTANVCAAQGCNPPFINIQDSCCVQGTRVCTKDSVSIMCIQNEGYYLENGKCIKCQPQCKTCLGNKCIVCKSSYVLQNDKCVPCPAGKYQNNGQCLPCKQHCKSCISENDCRSCFNPFIVKNNSCIQCPQTLYGYDDKCLPCQQNCLKCNSSTQCSQCSSGYDLVNENCVKKCLSTQLLKDGVCTVCENNCNNCNLNTTDTLILVERDSTVTVQCIPQTILNNNPNCKKLKVENGVYSCSECDSQVAQMTTVIRNQVQRQQCVLKSLLQIATPRCLTYKPFKKIHYCVECVAGYSLIQIPNKQNRPWYQCYLITFETCPNPLNPNRSFFKTKFSCSA